MMMILIFKVVIITTSICFMGIIRQCIIVHILSRSMYILYGILMACYFSIRQGYYGVSDHFNTVYSVVIRLLSQVG